MHLLKILDSLSQPKRVTRIFVIDGKPSLRAIVNLMEEAKVAQEFSVTDLQKFMTDHTLNTNDGSIEVLVEEVQPRNSYDGTEKKTRDPEIGVYNG